MRTPSCPAYRRQAARGCPKAILAAAALLLAAIATPAAALAAGADERLEAANHHYHEGRFEEAARELDGLLSEEDLARPTRIRALEILASARVALGDDEAARENVAAILDLDPDHLLDPDSVSPGLMKSFYRILDERGQLGYTGEIETLAVLDLKNHSVSEREAMEALGQGLADALITRISGAGAIRVVERERINYIRGEIGLNQTDEFDRQSAVRAGKLLGAHSFLLGGFTRLDDELRIDARLVKTETGEILKTHTVEGDIEDIFELVDGLAEQVVSALSESQSLPKVKEEAGFEALVEYSRGLRSLDAGDLAVAYKHFQKSATMSPDFEKASTRIRQLQPLVELADASRL